MKCRVSRCVFIVVWRSQLGRSTLEGLIGFRGVVCYWFGNTLRVIDVGRVDRV